MRAVVCRAGELTVEDVPTPEPGPGQVLIRVLRAGICGSDLHARVHCDATAEVSDEVGYDAFMRSDQSVIMGHEFAGEVVSYGPRCRKKWAPGTRVVAVPMIRHGEKAHLTGLSASAGGAYAQFTLVSEDMTFEIPDGLPIEHAALTEPLAVAHHAVRRGEVGRRDVAVVIGCGPIGLAVIAMLKASGVRTVIASDLSAGRRALAERVGADIVVDPAVESPFARCAEEGKYVTEAQDLLGAAFDAMRTLRRIPLVPWSSLFRVADRLGATPKGPVVFECVGTPGMIEYVVSDAPFRSRIVVVGVCMEPDTFRPAMAINKEHELRFVFCYDPAEYEETLHMIADGDVDVAPMITATIGLDGVATAFDALGSAEHHAKVLVDPMSEIDSL
ncbi:alcohol dehydrogenase [Gordonia paraffinivorans]|uniref:zinc-binding dehydrogenase n=1 Tax=Gordonia paraffinivorans TaxID=175628 RepID=UPI000D621EC1|nr:zinc-binding dehydrogenase [Gordonia paraffinivorans]MBY4575425.1 alcohol dehydrogenase [Gordonia paraffinivorans]PWD43322.1 alcohol dehydrogenase [Gordonia paraffinivorans]